jgi:tRNA pseudouridine55 synthase
VVKPTQNPIDGFLLIHKPEGPTSHHVVNHIKRTLHPERIGHLGTLDPFASGVLPIMLGGATKLADTAMDQQKGYLFEVALGCETDTLDPSGRVVRDSTMVSHTSFEPTHINKILAAFRGDVAQVPPAYSALKKDGRPLYEYMRAEGKLPFDIAEKSRTVHIASLQFLGVGEPVGQPPLGLSEEATFDFSSRPTLRFEVICTKGTYVRCLARDIALALGTFGFCARLCRHEVGPWPLRNALAWTPDLTAQDYFSAIQEPQFMAPHLPVIDDHSSQNFERLAAGNGFELEFEPFRSILNGAPLTGKCLFSSKSLQYLADYTIVGNTLNLQPRKKIRSAGKVPP